MCKRVIIVTGGEVDLSDLKMINEEDVLISADAGVTSFLQIGLLPHHAVGDFDTLHHHVLKKIEKTGISLKKLPIHKEETDTHYAVRLATEYNPDEIVIVGALGGARLDHMLANVGLLEWLCDQGVAAYLLNSSNRIRLLRGPISWEIEKSSFSYVSFIPVSSTVKGVTTAGLLYPLHNATLYRGRTQGISNELTGESGVIRLEKGKCLVIESKDY